MLLSGKTAIVTGSNTGIGFETASELYKQDGKVYIACRDEVKALDAISRIKSEASGGELVYRHLDLSSLKSVKEFAEKIISEENRLDLLVNNAGVMIPPPSLSTDGFELQFAVNYIGHFALSGFLFDLMESTAGARVITLSSNAHRKAVIDFDNFRLEKPYNSWREYGQSKAADLIFALEYEKRLKANKCNLISLASHPGYSKTDLQKYMDTDMLNSLELMTAKEGAQPTITACINPDVMGGQYWGPDGPNEQKGKPGLAKIDQAALDEKLNSKLWDWTENVTGLKFPY